jgi:hypothetical protein
MTPACRRERVRLGQHAPVRRQPCRRSWPLRLAERLYVGHVAPSGLWTLSVVEDTRTWMLIAAAGSIAPRLMATAMLADAFAGRMVREDLIDAFVEAWTPPDGGFVLPADLVAGWSLRWALDQPD